jgi:hypothetical protein
MIGRAGSQRVPQERAQTTIRLLWTGAGVGVLAAVWNRYQRDLRRDYERLHTFGPSVSETRFGRVAYAEAGDGPPCSSYTASSASVRVAGTHRPAA